MCSFSEDLYILSAPSLLYGSEYETVLWSSCSIFPGYLFQNGDKYKLSERKIFRQWQSYAEEKSPFEQLLVTIKHEINANIIGIP